MHNSNETIAGNKSATETAGTQLLERELRESDLITSDSFLEDARNVLRSYEVPFAVEKYTEGVMIDPKNETRTPGEFVLVIKDRDNPSAEASTEGAQQAFKFLKDAGVVVRYAKPSSTTIN